jgi:hypothetical protein
LCVSEIAVNILLRLKTALLAAGLIHTPMLRSSQVYLSNQSAAPGTSILVPVAFASEDGSISGVQFDVEYDSGAINLNATLGDAARNSAKSLYSADLTVNKRRFLVVGFNQNTIPDGVLIRLLVPVCIR